MLITLPTIKVDTREQLPLSFDGLHIRGVSKLPTITAKLDEGDYSVVGFEDKLFIERKSANDLYGTMFRGRDRFERELERTMGKQEKKFLVIESSPYLFLKYMENHDKMKMYNAAIATFSSWALKYDLDIRWCKTREGSADFIAKEALKLLIKGESNETV